MSVVHFVTVLGLLGGSRVLQTSSWYLCDSSINDYDVCNSNGMAAYVSYGATDPPQPSVFYPVSETNLTFTQKFVNNVLGVDLTQQALVSGKFSGIFIPTESGNYSFALFLNHKSSVGTKFSVSSTTGIIDMDLSAGGTAYNETCEYWDTDNCTLSDEVTNCLVCNRTFELTENGEYSLFAGLNESVGVPYAGNLYVGLTFTSPSGTTRYVTDADAVVSLTALVSRAENAARARKESAVIISTSVGSSLLGFMIIAAIITIILVKRKGTDNDRKRDRFAKGKENARSSMENSAESYAKSDRNSINDGSTKSHAKSNKNSINDGSTRSHAKSNKNSINDGSIKGDAENSRRSSARDSSNAGRNSSRRGSAGGNAKTDSKGNKESSVRDSSKVGRKSSRRGSAGGNTRADSKGNTKSSARGNTIADSMGNKESSVRDSSKVGRKSSRRGSAGGNTKTDSKGNTKSSAGGNTIADSKGNKESSVRDSSKVGRKSSRRGSAGGNTRADSKGNTKSSVGGNTKAGSKVVRKMVLEGV